jgi:hypothetical protein
MSAVTAGAIKSWILSKGADAGAFGQWPGKTSMQID